MHLENGMKLNLESRCLEFCVLTWVPESEMSNRSSCSFSGDCCTRPCKLGWHYHSHSSLKKVAGLSSNSRFRTALTSHMGLATGSSLPPYMRPFVPSVPFPLMPALHTLLQLPFFYAWLFCRHKRALSLFPWSSTPHPKLPPAFDRIPAGSSENLLVSLVILLEIRLWRLHYVFCEMNEMMAQNSVLVSLSTTLHSIWDIWASFKSPRRLSMFFLFSSESISILQSNK